MSGVNFLEKLLDGVDVAWKPLGEVGVFIRGNGLQKKDFVEEGFPAIHYGQIYTKYSLSAENTFSFVSNELANKLKQAKYNDLLLATTSENDEDVVKPLAWLGTSAAISGDMMLFRHQQNVKYLAHFFKTSHFQEEKKKYISGAKVRRVSSGDLAKIRVPIPCPDNPKKSLEIQAEIVRILDAMTAHTAELTAELTARKKQYNYYRDKLLSFEDGEVEWKTLGEVTKKWYSGGTPTAGNPEYYENGNIPWLRTQEVVFTDIFETEVKITQAALDNSSAKWIPENCVIIAISGATAGRSAINKIPLTTNQHCGCLEINPNLALYRYIFHWVSFNYENIKSLGQGARGDLNSTIIKNFKIPIPFASDPKKSLAEQARIVAILDKFDALTTSMTEGLPREIELRQKQYAYYRDLLLSFPQAQAA